MADAPPPDDDLTPPGPPVEESTPPGGGLSVDEWMAANRSRFEVDPYRTPRPASHPPASKKMAGWALAFSLALCIPFAFVVGFGLAIAVLVRSRDGRNHGRGMAIAALVISTLVVVGNVVLVVVIGIWGFDDTERDSEGTITDAGEVSMERLRIGDCYNDPSIADAQADEAFAAAAVVDAVPCSEPHVAEVAEIITLSDGDYPGEKAIDARAEACYQVAWRMSKGLPDRRQLGLVYAFPSPTTWRIGDRDIVCAIVRLDGEPMTGSIVDR